MPGHSDRWSSPADELDLGAATAGAKSLPSAFDHSRPDGDSLTHARKVRRSRRTVRQQLRELACSDSLSRVEWGLDH